MYADVHPLVGSQATDLPPRSGPAAAWWWATRTQATVGAGSTRSP